MIEILYSPKHDELFLFTGAYEIDDRDKVMTLYLIKRKNSFVTVDAKDLIHVGYL